jgi:RNA polymerase sigma-70 factor (ECF subfamily)
LTIAVPEPTPSSPSKLSVVRAEPASDTALCRAFLNGDSNSFGELVRRHQETVYRVIRRYASRPEDAYDLVQRAFLQAFEAARRTLPRLDRASGGDIPFKAWVLRIAINLAKNHSRHTRRWKLSALETLAPLRGDDVSAQTALEGAEAEAMTRAAVLALPKRQREVFTLRIDAGLPFAEIGKTLGITEANAKTHFHYAVKRLRDEVQAVLMKQNPGGSP